MTRAATLSGIQTYTDKRCRPLALRALITFWPVRDRIRALNPDVLFCLRLVPPRVRFVILNIRSN